MSSASEDVSEPSLRRTSEIRLPIREHWSQKAKDNGVGKFCLDQQHSQKPGGEHHSKGSINGHLERTNLLSALRKVDI